MRRTAGVVIGRDATAGKADKDDTTTATPVADTCVSGESIDFAADAVLLLAPPAGVDGRAAAASAGAATPSRLCNAANIRGLSFSARPVPCAATGGLR